MFVPLFVFITWKMLFALWIKPPETTFRIQPPTFFLTSSADCLTVGTSRTLPMLMITGYYILMNSHGIRLCMLFYMHLYDMQSAYWCYFWQQIIYGLNLCNWTIYRLLRKESETGSSSSRCSWSKMLSVLHKTQNVLFIYWRFHRVFSSACLISILTTSLTRSWNDDWHGQWQCFD